MKQLRFATVLFFTFLIGIPLMAQENNAKCVMLKTSQGETLEYYISSHPRLTQNNDKVTLTTDDETLEFGTIGIKKVYTSIATIKVVYMLDGEVYKTYYHHAGIKLKSEPPPTKEGYNFSGWSNEPTIMPDHNVTVTGTMSINKYKLTYMVDGEEYKSFEVKYGATVTAEAAPTKEGYTFSGWSEIPSTMPAHDVTVTGTFTVNKYTITYMIDDEIYQTESVDYGSTIIPPSAPEREGCIFGWINVPETMPAHDITIIGSYTAGIGGVYSESIIVNSGNVLYLSGLKPGESVSVYSISGKLMLLEKVSAQGDLTISLSSLTQNVYIIKTNSETYKISIK